jgi:hypothetical protein
MSADATERTQRTPEQLRSDLEAQRAQVGDTVAELADRADVPARVRARREETTEQVKAQVARGRGALAEKAPAVDRAIDERPGMLAGGGALLLGFLLLRRRRRARRAARTE